MDLPGLPHSPAAERNKEPILHVLRDLLGPQGTALEIASGTGQHAVHFAAALQGWRWQPSEADRGLLPAIVARIQHAGLHNVWPPLQLDVLSPGWPSVAAAFSERFDAIFCANMLHIAPWSCCAALMQGAARHLAPQGLLLTYGPYVEPGVPLGRGNVEFDASLRASNPAWGIRTLHEVEAEARRAGLVLRERRPMPADNLLLVFSPQVPPARG